jgi:NADH dehydrogenase/NADH:ubiquinone oxidoreductase subunit G
MIRLTIDGKEVVAREGQTVLEVAKEAGVFIPALCYHHEVKPYTSCRLCMVEVTVGKRTRFVTACDYRVVDGMVVYTDTEKVQRCRRMVLELLMARCPNLPQLQELAQVIGVEQVRFPKSNDDCILCGLCVRACSEVVNLDAIGFEGRGFTRRVCTPFDEPSDSCILCGACSYVCPVDVIPVEDKDGYRTMERWHKRSLLVACIKCERYFMTEDELKLLKDKTGLPEDQLKVCSDCR